MRASKSSIFAGCLLAFAVICRGQTNTASTPPAVKADYAGEPIVIVDRHSLISMHADGTGFRQTAIVFRVQTESAVRQFGVVQIGFASAAEHAEFLYVRVRHANGTVTETPVSGALEQPTEVTREAPFYSDQKTLQIPVKDLRSGDTLEWSARVTRTVPEAPGQFWGQETFVNDGVALAEALELHVPAATHVTLWTNPDVPAPKESTTNGEHVITWSSRHLNPSVGPEADAAKKKLLTPEQDLATRKGALPSLAWTTFPDWAAVGAWYRGLEGDRAKADPAVEAKVAEITAGKATDLEKAQAIYTYVASQIRYIGVAFGVGRYQPHGAAEVLANQYGDCKDKHTLLAAMLAQVGLQSDAVLIGAGLRFNPDVPSPGSFNHLITQLHLDGKTVWLDSTAEVAPWGTLFPSIRDQQALVVPASSAATLRVTEAAPPFISYTKALTKETLDTDLASDARVTLTFHDDDELTLRALLRQISPAQYEQFTQRFVASLGYGGTTSEPTVEHLNDLTQPIALSFRYKRVKEAEWGENRVTTPFWAIVLPTVNDKEPPVGSIELGTPRTETSTVEIRVPQGFGVELPEAVHAKADFASVDTTFHLNNGVITAERKLTVLQPRVPAANWHEYSKWSEAAQFNSYPYLQLKPPNKGRELSPATAAKTGADGSAGQLVSEAEDALQKMNTTEATRLLDQVKAQHPQQPFLWSEYAFSAYLQGKMSEATEDVNKELALHPDEVQLNGLLATIQQARGDHNAAIASLYRWALAAPENPQPITALVGLLHAAKRDEEALSIGGPALTRLGSGSQDLTQLRLVLANVQGETGHKAEAAATLAPLAKTVKDPFQANSVAYMLADAKVDLPADESMEKEVLTNLDGETASWTLDESPRTLSSRTDLLVASWDTMGWILFQEGHLPEARAYIAAAWMNASRPEVLDHLHAIDKALHQPTREEAVSDQNRRIFTLGPSHGRHGTAELRLLLGQGKVLRAEPAEDTSPSNAAPHPGVSPALSDAASLAKGADVHALFPGNSHANLMRRGIVNCSGSACQLVLLPMSVH